MPWKKRGEKTWRGVKTKTVVKAERKTFKGTPQQEKIWEAVTESEGHIVVEALAGTGKTTTMVEALYRIQEADPSIEQAFVAFSKSIAEELQSKVPDGVSACTLHSHGFKALRDAFRGLKVSDWKVTNIIEDLYGGKDTAKLQDETKLLAIEKVVNLARQTFEYDGETFTEDSYELLIDRYGIDVGKYRNEIYDRVHDVFAESEKLFQSDKTIDFTDMIWLPLVMDLRLTRYDNLIVDEAQDMNRVQQELIKRSITRGGRIIAVGDRYQSIFGFTGADIDSIPNLIRDLNKPQVLPLTVTHRCPTTHVELVKKLVPHYETPKKAKKGELSTLPVNSYDSKLSGGDMVMCRVNAPLIGGALRCISQSKKAVVKGRDVGKYVVAFMNKFKVDRVADLAVKLEDYKEEETERINAYKDKKLMEMKLMALEDTVACCHALCEGETTVAAVGEKVKRLFTDDGTKDDTIMFTSIHKAKGLEAKRTMILQPEIMQHPSAKTTEQKMQEKNVQHVGLTRSKSEMFFVLSDRQQGMTATDFV